MRSTYRILITFLIFGLAPGLRAGTWSSENIAGMDVELYVPTTPPSLAGKRALMISLHGCIQTASDLQAGGNWAPSADKYGMVVALPQVPGGGSFMGCWDYYGADHTRTSRDDVYLINLVQALLARRDLSIDSRQVYLSGLSSGGGETLVMGCLAPDLFAGIGVAAGPSVGTSSSGYSFVTTDASAVVQTCRQLAGSAVDQLSTQIASIIKGTSDFTVAQGYGELNADAIAELYGISASPLVDSLPGNVSESLWKMGAQPRVSLVTVPGLGHAWPAGQPPGGSFIDSTLFDYPAYLSAFLFQNNQRVGTTLSPPTTQPVRPTTSTPTEVTATLQSHIDAGRLSYAQYAQYYLKYGSKAFALYQQPDGSWSDVPPSA